MSKSRKVLNDGDFDVLYSCFLFNEIYATIHATRKNTVVIGNITENENPAYRISIPVPIEETDQPNEAHKRIFPYDDRTKGMLVFSNANESTKAANGLYNVVKTTMNNK